MDSFKLSLYDLLQFWDHLNEDQKVTVMKIVNNGSYDPSFRTDTKFLPEEDKVIHYEAAKRYGSFMVKDLIKVYSSEKLTTSDKSIIEDILKTLFITEHTLKDTRYVKRMRRLTNMLQ